MGKHSYPAGGWLPEGAHFDWQHADQGRDFVTNWQGVIQAPGDGECVEVGADRPFPNGFGPHYPMVRINTGKFAGHTYYIGHCSALVRVGEKFGFGHPLAKADQGHNFSGTNGGWVEFGERQPNGTLGPNNPNGHWFDALLRAPLVIKTPDPPLKYGDQGWRVLGMTSDLRNCGWLGRPYWHFNQQVHGAVVAFKQFHHIPMPAIRNGGPDRGIADARTLAAIKHAGDWCKKHGKEHK